MKKLAYYKGCLASLSAKELDISTRALAPKVGYELIELESVTCCGAGDIHEAEPDYYLHLNARITFQCVSQIAVFPVGIRLDNKDFQFFVGNCDGYRQLVVVRQRRNT